MQVVSKGVGTEDRFHCQVFNGLQGFPDPQEFLSKCDCGTFAGQRWRAFFRELFRAQMMFAFFVRRGSVTLAE
jgi:hypothetical protein